VPGHNNHLSINPIFALGSNHSGASLIAEILEILCAAPGQEQSHPDGRGGRSLSAAASCFKATNDEILRALGGNWDEPPQFPTGWPSLPEIASLRRRLAPIIDREYGGRRTPCWTDPQGSLTLPFWQAMFPAVRCIICVRNPLDVARVFRRRHRFSLQKSAALWLAYNRSALEHTAGRTRLVICYEDLIENTEHVVRELAQLVGQADAGAETLARRAVADRLRQRRHRQSSSVEDAASHEALPFKVKTLYLCLRSAFSAVDTPAASRTRHLLVNVLGHFSHTGHPAEDPEVWSGMGELPTSRNGNETHGLAKRSQATEADDATAEYGPRDSKPDAGNSPSLFEALPLKPPSEKAEASGASAPMAGRVSSVKPGPSRPLHRTRCDNAACTIISKNYLAQARVLANSFRKHHPDTPFFVLLVDRVDGCFQPEHEPFTLIPFDELPLRDRYQLAFKYDIIELNTAVKPCFLEHLFRAYGVRKVLYLDPDILILREMSALFDLLDHRSIILTPHLLTALEEDGHEPSDATILRAGTYNLGFLGLANNDTTKTLLKWWQNKLSEACQSAPERGMFVDQKWMDLTPGLFDGVYILRDPGYNVAYWNLPSRATRIRGKTVLVNKRPCYFFHFSGFDPDYPDRVSKHTTRLTMDKLGGAAGLFHKYRELLVRSGHNECKKWPYAFDSFANGVKIPALARQLFQQLGDQASQFPNPFNVRGPRTYYQWLTEDVQGNEGEKVGISRLWYEVHQRRPDVRNAYPDPLGTHRDLFLEWIVRSGFTEAQIDERLAPWRAGQEGLPDVGARQAGGGPAPQEAFGINVAGHVTSEKGVGEGVRSDLNSLDAVGVPYVINNFSDSGSSNFDHSFSRFSWENPYAINLIHVNAEPLPLFVQQKGEQYLANRYNIGYWAWELSTFPGFWRNSFEYVDEIWVPSNFVLEAVSRSSPVPVVRMPHAIGELATQPLGRADFGLPSDKFIFFFAFDFHSYTERKNPLGLIRAFQKAFARQDDVMLVIKCSRGRSSQSDFRPLQKLARGTNVRLLDTVLSRQEMNSLMSLADCYVSLHRSEGFGLTMAEAMKLGKPVIATGYSGNLDFMTPWNSWLVKHKMVEITEDHGPYRRGNVWADPDTDDAARLMRFVYDNPTTAKRRARRGQEDITRNFAPSVVGAMMKERLLSIRGSFRLRPSVGPAGHAGGERDLGSPAMASAPTVAAARAPAEERSGGAMQPGNAQWLPRRYPPMSRAKYQQLVRGTRAVVERLLPRDATVVVVSKGDDELVRLGSRRGWHFPQTPNRVYAGHYPAHGRSAISHLEDLRKQGAQFLVFPSTAFWWLVYYTELNDHLEKSYRRIYGDDRICIIFELKSPNPPGSTVGNNATLDACSGTSEEQRVPAGEIHGKWGHWFSWRRSPRRAKG
jgi:glycosyltransferase involved in cell wall biosynthesis